MKIRWYSVLVSAAGIVALALLAPVAANAQVPCPTFPGFPDLGGAAQYTVFALNGPLSGGSQKGQFSKVTVNGDVAVAAGATLTNMAPSEVNGDVYVDSAGKFTGPGKVNGTIFTNQNLAPARDSALIASFVAAQLSPNFTYNNITSNTTIIGVSGLNVVNVLGNISLNNASLTLTGPPDAFFVVNVGGSIVLVGEGGITVGGLVPVSHLLINMVGSGDGLIHTHVDNFIHGTLLGPNAGGSIDGTTGSLLLGRKFSLKSDAVVNFEGCRP